MKIQNIINNFSDMKNSLIEQSKSSAQQFSGLIGFIQEIRLEDFAAIDDINTYVDAKLELLNILPASPIMINDQSVITAKDALLSIITKSEQEYAIGEEQFNSEAMYISDIATTSIANSSETIQVSAQDIIDSLTKGFGETACLIANFEVSNITDVSTRLQLFHDKLSTTFGDNYKSLIPDSVSYYTNLLGSNIDEIQNFKSIAEAYDAKSVAESNDDYDFTTTPIYQFTGATAYNSISFSWINKIPDATEIIARGIVKVTWACIKWWSQLVTDINLWLGKTTISFFKKAARQVVETVYNPYDIDYANDDSDCYQMENASFHYSYTNDPEKSIMANEYAIETDDENEFDLAGEVTFDSNKWIKCSSPLYQTCFTTGLIGAEWVDAIPGVIGKTIKFTNQGSWKYFFKSSTINASRFNSIGDSIFGTNQSPIYINLSPSDSNYKYYIIQRTNVNYTFDQLSELFNNPCIYCDKETDSEEDFYYGSLLAVGLSYIYTYISNRLICNQVDSDDVISGYGIPVANEVLKIKKHNFTQNIVSNKDLVLAYSNYSDIDDSCKLFHDDDYFTTTTDFEIDFSDIIRLLIGNVILTRFYRLLGNYRYYNVSESSDNINLANSYYPYLTQNIGFNPCRYKIKTDEENWKALKFAAITTGVIITAVALTIFGLKVIRPAIRNRTFNRMAYVGEIDNEMWNKRSDQITQRDRKKYFRYKKKLEGAGSTSTSLPSLLSNILPGSTDVTSYVNDIRNLITAD